jgi:DNA modification methylase
VNAIQAQPGQRTIITGDCIEGMRTLPAGVVHTCVTSPPYWGLRDYGAPGKSGLSRNARRVRGAHGDVLRECGACCATTARRG